MIRPVDSALAALAVSALRDLAKAMPDHPAARFLPVYAAQIEGAEAASDGDYLATLLGVDLGADD